jgi:hypothetical protein
MKTFQNDKSKVAPVSKHHMSNRIEEVKFQFSVFYTTALDENDQIR